ncbi:MAG: hypothetical protein ABI551_26310 [Polyangiaceae bacterium]
MSCIAVVVASYGCGQHDNAPPSLACPESLATFCATPSPECVAHVDPSNIVDSYCATPQSGNSGIFGIYICGDAGTFALQNGTGTSTTTSFYDASGDLFAITRGAEDASCAAGPTTFVIPDCRGDLVGYQCIHDAGTD